MSPYMMGGGYGMQPYGMPPPAPAAPASSPFNPFNEGGAAVVGGGGGAFVGQRMENDPLNELTEQLLGAKPK